MSASRTIAPVVHRKRLGDDDAVERRAYWRSRTVEERILEVESLRRMWIERTGDPDQPIARVVSRRPLR